MEPIKTLAGTNGQLELFTDKVVIKRKGLMSIMTQGLKGDKSIPFASITNIQLKEPGFTAGYLQFGVLGGNESHGGVFDATKDENTVMFAKKSLDAARFIRDYIESSKIIPASTAAIQGVSDELKKLKLLLDEGALTQEEFDAQKKKLLA